MANEIQVSTSFPVLREINKSLKVVDSLLPSSNKLRWNDLDVSMKFLIFNEFFRSFFEEKFSNHKGYSYHNKYHQDMAFLKFLSDKDAFLNRYIEKLYEKHGVTFTNNLNIDSFWYHYIPLPSSVPDLAIEYCKEFNVDIYIEEYEDDTSEVKVKFLWEKIIIDYGFLKGRDISEIRFISFLFKECEFPIVHKNLDFLNKMDCVKEISVNGDYSWSDDELNKIFFSINCNNISGFWIGFEAIGNRVLNSVLRIASDFFPNIKMLCIGHVCLPSDEEIIDISFLSNLRKLEDLLLYRCKGSLDLEVLLKMSSLKSIALSGEIDTIEFQEQVKKLRENRPELKIDFY